MTPTSKQQKSAEFYGWRPLAATVGWKFLLLTLLLASFLGCGRKSTSSQVDPLPQRPLRAMDSALRRGQLQEARELADAVLESHSDDAAETLAIVARLAHDTGKPDVAAELLPRTTLVVVTDAPSTGLAAKFSVLLAAALAGRGACF